MEAVKSEGRIRQCGVSNLDTDDMDELVAPDRKDGATDQILYNLTRRGAEHDLLSWLEAHGLPAMAFSPVEQGRILSNPTLVEIAETISATSVQVALAWTKRQRGLIALPKAGSVAHVRENRAAAYFVLSDKELVAHDAAFPHPRQRRQFEML